MIKHPPHFRRILLTCCFLAWPLAPQAATTESAGSQGDTVITEDVLRAWFKKQDKVLDNILVRLSHIESLVAEIHDMLVRLPDFGTMARAATPITVATPASATTPAPTATQATTTSTAPPAPAAPPKTKSSRTRHQETEEDEEEKPDFLKDWLPQLAGGGVILLGLLWWLRRRSAAKSAAANFDKLAAHVDLELDDDEEDRGQVTPAYIPPPPAPPPPVAPAIPIAPAPIPDSEPPVAKSPTFVSTPLPASQSDQALELAEIMLSMGLGSGAAQTLTEQIRNEPKQALRHWLKLLAIYRKNGQQEEFERSAEELRQHFNVQPEDWKADPDSYRGIENYPHIAKRMTELWRTEDCLVYMQNLLDDNRGGARAGFPQTVAEELLLLTAIMKDE